MSDDLWGTMYDKLRLLQQKKVSSNGRFGQAVAVSSRKSSRRRFSCDRSLFASLKAMARKVLVGVKELEPLLISEDAMICNWTEARTEYG